MLYQIEIVSGDRKISVSAENGTRLSDVLSANGFSVDYVCGGWGTCGKCRVSVNGKDELACRYEINSDISVTVPVSGKIRALTAETKKDKRPQRCFVAVDVGTTTLAAALCSAEDYTFYDVISADNPQRKFGADVMSRIAYCSEHGPGELNGCIVGVINSMIGTLLSRNGYEKADRIYAAGNTTMLHLLMNTDCSSMGYYPYAPVFLNKLTVSPAECGIQGADEIVLLPGAGAFVGADIVSGLIFTGFPSENKYDILADLGTNAECVVYSRRRVLCTSAAAGPCFEGAGIEYGMSATDGAVCRYNPDGTYSVIGGCEEEGICATGLIDVIAVLLDKGVIDETGAMECEEYTVAGDVRITRKDIRQYQLAASAVCAAIRTLMKKAGITADDVGHFYVSGGFSQHINIENALRTGLFPRGLRDKFTPVNNSCLKGIPLFAKDENQADDFLKITEYTDLSTDPYFCDLFVEGMCFE